MASNSSDGCCFSMILKFSDPYWQRYFSSTWFSRLPWSLALLRNLHPYCHLRKFESSSWFWPIGYLYDLKNIRDEPILPDEVDEVDLNDFDPEADRQQQHHRMWVNYCSPLRLTSRVTTQGPRAFRRRWRRPSRTSWRPWRSVCHTVDR